MERKTILFTVDRDSISPRTEQKAGVQGQHNITDVRFEGDILSEAKSNPNEFKVRIHFIDGAGGFYSTGFLTVYSDETDGRLFVTCPIPNNVTNAGGLAYVYLVVTKITYEGEKALEDQEYISPPGKLFYTHSGVGSPSEYAYRMGISSALVNAEEFAGRAEEASEAAEETKLKAETAEADAYESAEQANENATYANKSAKSAAASAEAAKSAQEAAESSADEAKKIVGDADDVLNEIKTKLANGEFKGEKGDTGAQGEKGDKGDKGDQGLQGIQGVSGVYLGSGEMPEGYNVQIDPDGEPIEVYTKEETDSLLQNKIAPWQPNTEYKVGDICFVNNIFDYYLTSISRTLTANTPVTGNGISVNEEITNEDAEKLLGRSVIINGELREITEAVAGTNGNAYIKVDENVNIEPFTKIYPNIEDVSVYDYYKPNGLVRCIKKHISSDRLLYYDKEKWEKILANEALKDAEGNIIHTTYATKEEVGNIETVLDNIITEQEAIIAIQNALIGGDSV